MHKPIEKDDLPILIPYWPDEQIKRAFFFREFTSPMNFERLGRGESSGASPSHHAARLCRDDRSAEGESRVRGRMKGML
jgi:hypothetical protein